MGPQVQAIREQRALLDEPDPVPPLCDRLTQGLRGALQEAHQAYERTHEDQTGRLAGSEAWQKLPDDDRGRILRKQELGDVPEIKVGTQQEVLTTLQNRPLSAWRDQRDALPTRFENACIEAARRLEPKAVSMKLPPATLKTEEDVDLWWEGARAEIVEKLKKGPVIIG